MKRLHLMISNDVNAKLEKLCKATNQKKVTLISDMITRFDDFYIKLYAESVISSYSKKAIDN